MDHAKILALNVVGLRRARSLSQSQLGELCHIPRSTLAHIESGRGNPTLDVLLRLSRALGVRLDELMLAPPGESKLIKKGDFVPQTKADGKAIVTQLMPEATKGIQLERLELKPKAHLGGIPHIIGTREYFRALIGDFMLHVGGEPFLVEEGDLLIFNGNQKHAYQNPGLTHVVGLSVLFFEGD